MPDFRLEAPFRPTGDQPQAIDKLVDGLGRGLRNQVLLGATGTGKTFSIASVTCIYGLGAPVDYGATVVRLRTGGRYRRDGVLRQLVDLQYQRNDAQLSRARFRVRGDTLELQPAYDDFVVRVQFFGDEVERITEIDPLTGELLAERNELNVYPASHYVTPADKMKAAIVDIEHEMEQRVRELQERGMELEA